MNDKCHRCDGALADENIGDGDPDAAANGSLFVVGGEKDSQQVGKRCSPFLLPQDRTHEFVGFAQGNQPFGKVAGHFLRGVRRP